MTKFSVRENAYKQKNGCLVMRSQHIGSEKMINEKIKHKFLLHELLQCYYNIHFVNILNQ